jgi:hypothetical protein
VLASGNCIDGSICGAGKSSDTCKAGTTGSTKYSPATAASVAMFSTAYKEFGVGTHTVLIRQNSCAAAQRCAVLCCAVLLGAFVG